MFSFFHSLFLVFMERFFHSSLSNPPGEAQVRGMPLSLPLAQGGVPGDFC